ncbi:MAG: hypothetical protein AB7I18_00585 [Candidatus Berkiella sp.]
MIYTLTKPVPRTPVPTDLVNQFKDRAILSRSKTIPQVLDELLTDYLAANTLEETLSNELKGFQEHIRQAPLGQWLLFSFTSAIPTQLQALFEHVRLRENHLTRIMPSLIISGANNIAATSGMTVVFEEACRLERALINKEIEPIHIKSAEAKLKEWHLLNYRRFAEAITTAKDLNRLRIDFGSNLDPELCDDLPKSSDSLIELFEQFNLLEDNLFLDEFYSLRAEQEYGDSSLSPDEIQKEILMVQADFVKRFYDDFQTKTTLTTELHLTFKWLMAEITAKAYRPCDVRLHELMADPEVTVACLDQQIDKWVEEDWRTIKDGVLLTDLNTLLDEEMDALLDWEAVSAMNRPPTPLPQPAFEVFCFKYGLSDPKMKPATLLTAQEEPNEIPRSPTPELAEEEAQEISRPSTPGLAEEQTQEAFEAIAEQMARININDAEIHAPIPTRERRFSF